MAQMGCGYGSEYQLLRFLGHHRVLFEKEICKQASLSGTFHWLDFDFASNASSISGDAEITGLGFLKTIPFIQNDSYKKIIKNYKSYKIGKPSTWQYWDAIFTLDKTIYLVEAKAHVEEIPDPKPHGGKSQKMILNYMKDMLPNLSISEKWLGEYYQMANRLATTAFLNKWGIKAKTMYIYFLNGFDKRIIERRRIKFIENKDASKEDFKNAIKIEMNTLGLSHDSVKDLLMPPVFIDANPLKE